MGQGERKKGLPETKKVPSTEEEQVFAQLSMSRRYVAADQARAHLPKLEATRTCPLATQRGMGSGPRGQVRQMWMSGALRWQSTYEMRSQTQSQSREQPLEYEPKAEQSSAPSGCYPRLARDL